MKSGHLTVFYFTFIYLLLSVFKSRFVENLPIQGKWVLVTKFSSGFVCTKDSWAIWEKASGLSKFQKVVSFWLVIVFGKENANFFSSIMDLVNDCKSQLIDLVIKLKVGQSWDILQSLMNNYTTKCHVPPSILRKLYSTDILYTNYTNLGLKVGMAQFVEVGCWNHITTYLLCLSDVYSNSYSSLRLSCF